MFNLWFPNYKEREYGTDSNKPNFLLAYALKKLPENEALKFKNVENFNESSKVLVDYFSSLPENIRNSKEVNDLLNQILSDNIINELEKNLFYDKFVLPSLPLIFNLEWFPTREKLDKIYDINVTFVAKDDNTPIAYAELRFVPVEYYYMIEKYGMRQEDYPKVFPPDKERVYVLTPVDGKFDSLEEKFVVSITNIIGGREYKIVVLIRDIAGNERITEIKTPYIRQFENLGRINQLKTCVTMVPFGELFEGKWWHPTWHKPLLGKYSLSDPIVISKHVGFATGHGVNCFFIDTQWNNFEKISEVVTNSLFFEKGVVFALLYNSITSPSLKKIDGWKIDFNDENNIKGLKEDFYIIATKFFKKFLTWLPNGHPHDNKIKLKE